MGASHENITRMEHFALLTLCVLCGLCSALLVVAAFQSLWLAVLGAVIALIAVGICGWFVLDRVSDRRWELIDAAMDTFDIAQGANRLRLRVIIHQALLSAIALTGDPAAEDLVDVDQLDYLTERTVDALITTGPVHRRTDDAD